MFFLPQYWKLLRRNKAAAVTAVALLLTGADEVAIADRTIITDGTVERAEAHGELPTSTALIRNIGMWGVIISIIACTLILIYSYMSKTAAWWGIESWFIML